MRTFCDDIKDIALPSYAEQIIKAKMRAGAAKNRFGWWDHSVLDNEALQVLLEVALDSGNYHDLMVYAAMIAYRAELKEEEKGEAK